MNHVIRNRWGAAGPPAEAYGQLTHPERFASLHGIASFLADELCQRFEVIRTIGYEFDHELERGLTLAQPTMRLVPQQSGAASLVVVFTTFPGLRVRFGRSYISSFPECGCDACDETAENEGNRLKWLITNTVEGRFRESIRVDGDGSAWNQCEFWTADGTWSRTREPMDPDRARILLAEGSFQSVHWHAWSPR